MRKISVSDYPDIFEKGKHYGVMGVHLAYIGRTTEGDHLLAELYRNEDDVNTGNYTVFTLKKGTFICDGKNLIATERTGCTEQRRTLNKMEEKLFELALEEMIVPAWKAVNKTSHESK